jgi:diaminohydroxyphosphoribosylaminopyrimidine deaminase/5-amino-6-(5-phosphoribosylamino)uracil reductase
MNQGQWSQQDRRFMARALELARQGLGQVEPNPAVGAVLVRGGQIIGQGYHHQFGGPHAEVDALENARQNGENPKNATLYVTLEPCCHFGKTPPCTQAIIEAGVGKVIVASVDPSAKVAGKGIAALQSAGIDVQAGLMSDEAETLNGWFFKFHREHRPWVIAKWAQTLDGKLAARTGHSQWISGPEARREAHKLRQTCQAVVVGIGTALADDPSLTVRLESQEYESAGPRVPNRVVLDAKLCLPISAKLVQTAGEAPTWIFTSDRADQCKVDALRKMGVHVATLPESAAGRLSLPAFLKLAADEGWARVMVEGGAALLSAFFAENMVDEIRVFQTGMLALDDQAHQLHGLENPRVDDFLKMFRFESADRVGNDVMLTLRR